MKSTTPTSLKEDVLEFCKEIDPLNEPTFVEVVPYEESEYQECIQNVQNYTKKFGGKIQYGWTIWEIPKKFIEAEFHAIWIDKNGKCLDISPKPDGEEKILFLKSNKKEFSDKPVDNIRKILLDRAEFRTLKIVGEKQFELRLKYWNGFKSEIPLCEMNNLIKFERETFSSEIQKDKLSGKIKIGRNELCPCGSGKKYKKCCLKS